MSEPAYFKVSCGSCDGHIAYPATSAGQTVACPHCAKDVFLPYQSPAPEILEPTVVDADYPQNFRRPTSPPANRPASTPVLWNPMAAAYWSLIFSPAFGAFIHAQNADTLGRTKEAGINRMWFYFSLAYLGFVLASGFIFPTVPNVAFRFPALIFYCCWFYVGEKQVKYVKANWQKNYQRKSWAVPLLVALGCWIVLVAVGIIVVAVMPAGSESAKSQTAPPPQAQAAQVEVQQPTRMDSRPAESVQMEPTPPPVSREVPQYEWNTSEIDALQNGNIGVAVNWMRRNSNLRQQATTPRPDTVATTPYAYYGRVVAFRGEVAVVQNFPPGSDFSNGLGGQNTSDIVMETADGTAVELFCMKACGNIRAGHIVNLYGYPVGVTEVKNRIGGTFTHLILVGNDYDDFGAAR